MLDALIRERVNAEASMGLVIVGSVLSVLDLAATRGTVTPLPTLVTWFAIGVTGGWIIYAAYSRLWPLFRREWWRAHVWLTWLECQIGDPTNPLANVSQDLIHLVRLSPHPGLQRLIDRARAAYDRRAASNTVRHQLS